LGILSVLLNRKNVSQKATVSVLGPSKAGKTTLIRYLETGLIEEGPLLPTLGIDYRNKPINVDKWDFNIIDVGGQKLYQETFWELALEQSNGLIYVIDSTIRPDKKDKFFQTQIKQFEYALDLLQSHIPIMILLNKQDLTDLNPIQAKEFQSIYPQQKLHRRTVTILPSAVKYGQGVENAMLWFIDSIQETLP